MTDFIANIGDGERWLIMMFISFAYGFFLRHMITSPLSRRGKQ